MHPAALNPTFTTPSNFTTDSACVLTCATSLSSTGFSTTLDCINSCLLAPFVNTSALSFVPAFFVTLNDLFTDGGLGFENAVEAVTDELPLNLVGVGEYELLGSELAFDASSNNAGEVGELLASDLDTLGIGENGELVADDLDSSIGEAGEGFFDDIGIGLASAKRKLLQYAPHWLTTERPTEYVTRQQKQRQQRNVLLHRLVNHTETLAARPFQVLTAQLPTDFPSIACVRCAVRCTEVNNTEGNVTISNATASTNQLRQACMGKCLYSCSLTNAQQAVVREAMSSRSAPVKDSRLHSRHLLQTSSLSSISDILSSFFGSGSGMTLPLDSASSGFTDVSSMLGSNSLSPIDLSTLSSLYGTHNALTSSSFDQLVSSMWSGQQLPNGTADWSSALLAGAQAAAGSQSSAAGGAPSLQQPGQLSTMPAITGLIHALPGMPGLSSLLGGSNSNSLSSQLAAISNLGQGTTLTTPNAGAPNSDALTTPSIVIPAPVAAPGLKTVPNDHFHVVSNELLADTSNQQLTGLLLMMVKQYASHVANSKVGTTSSKQRSKHRLLSASKQATSTSTALSPCSSHGFAACTSDCSSSSLSAAKLGLCVNSCATAACPLRAPAAYSLQRAIDLRSMLRYVLLLNAFDYLVPAASRAHPATAFAHTVASSSQCIDCLFAATHPRSYADIISLAEAKQAHVPTAVYAFGQCFNHLADDDNAAVDRMSNNWDKASHERSPAIGRSTTSYRRNPRPAAASPHHKAHQMLPAADVVGTNLFAGRSWHLLRQSFSADIKVVRRLGLPAILTSNIFEADTDVASKVTHLANALANMTTATAHHQEAQACVPYCLAMYDNSGLHLLHSCLQQCYNTCANIKLRE